jgi:hypothetical protein
MPIRAPVVLKVALLTLLALVGCFAYNGTTAMPTAVAIVPSTATAVETYAGKASRRYRRHPGPRPAADFGKGQYRLKENCQDEG